MERGIPAGGGGLPARPPRAFTRVPAARANPGIRAVGEGVHG